MRKFLFAFLTIVLSFGESWAPVPGELPGGLTGWFCGGCSGSLAIYEGTPECDADPCNVSCYSCGGGTTTNKSESITGGTRYWKYICTGTSIPRYCADGVFDDCNGIL